MEGDLHDISRRVQEYDSGTRLVRQDGSGRLGLAVEQKRGLRRWLMFARELYDLDSNLPLDGVPDARVLRCQRAMDGRRFTTGQQWLEWTRSMERADAAREARENAEVSDQNGEIAEGFVHSWGKTMTTHRPRAFIRRGIPRKEAA